MRPFKTLSLFGIFLTLISITYSCDALRVFEENKAIENGVWNASSPVVFNVDVDDTLSANTFYLNLRHEEAYPYSNIFLFLHTKFPNGKEAQDTLELMLQRPDGKWNGSGAGGLRDHQIAFKKGLRFPLKGKYVFSITQAMRGKELGNVREVGLRIEKSKE
jgi:gliding motility-associated lipoprotein GldH